MNTYVLVLVDYDWYRFQKNIAVNSDKNELLKYCTEKLPIYEYEDGDSEIESALCAKEERHYWIQKF